MDSLSAEDLLKLADLPLGTLSPRDRMFKIALTCILASGKSHLEDVRCGGVDGKAGALSDVKAALCYADARMEADRMSAISANPANCYATGGLNAGQKRD